MIATIRGRLPVLFGATAGTAPHACPYIDHWCDNYTLFFKDETYKIKSHITFNVICKPLKFSIYWGNQTLPQRPF